MHNDTPPTKSARPAKRRSTGLTLLPIAQVKPNMMSCREKLGVQSSPGPVAPGVIQCGFGVSNTSGPSGPVTVNCACHQNFDPGCLVTEVNAHSSLSLLDEL